MADCNVMLDTITSAVARRASLRSRATDALRLIHGAGDGLPGIVLEDFAGRLLWQSQSMPEPEVWAAVQAAGVEIRSAYWKQHDPKALSTPQWVAGETVSEPFEIVENATRYLVDFTAGYSQGIFLDQRLNRLWVREQSAGQQVLNTFAYTCGFGAAAACGGGTVLDIDLSKHWLEWGARNYQANGIAPRQHDAIYGDVMDWLPRLHRRGRKFDLIILDPPSFARSGRGKTFRVERDYPELVRRASALLATGGQLLCCTNLQRLGMPQFHRLIREGLPQPARYDFMRRNMPADFPGPESMLSVHVRHK